MNVDWGAEVALQVESHWHDHLRPRWQGLTDEEYFWQPVEGCWTVSRRGRSRAPDSIGAGDFTWDLGDTTAGGPVTTIAWRLAHLTVGLAQTTGERFGGTPTDPTVFAYAGTAADALDQIDGAFASWLSGVRGLGATGLAEDQGPPSPPEFAEAPVVRLVLYTSAEVIHHGAEVSLLRDLYAARPSP